MTPDSAPDDFLEAALTRAETLATDGLTLSLEELKKYVLDQRQAELMKVDTHERMLQLIGQFRGPRTSELRKKAKSTRKE